MMPKNITRKPVTNGFLLTDKDCCFAQKVLAKEIFLCKMALKLIIGNV